MMLDPKTLLECNLYLCCVRKKLSFNILLCLFSSCFILQSIIFTLQPFFSGRFLKFLRLGMRDQACIISIINQCRYQCVIDSFISVQFLLCTNYIDIFM